MFGLGLDEGVRQGEGSGEGLHVEEHDAHGGPAHLPAEQQTVELPATEVAGEVVAVRVGERWLVRVCVSEGASEWVDVSE